MNRHPQHRHIVYLVTEDWYFWAHRRLLAGAARNAGYHVTVATRVSAHGDRIRAEGFDLVPLKWRRGSLNPFGLLRDVSEIAKLYRSLRPDIVHHISLKPIILGSIASLALPGLPVLNALTGLGATFIGKTMRMRLLAHAVTAVLRPLLRRQHSLTLFENEDDRRLLVARVGVPTEKTAVNRGSGVDLSHFVPLPLPQNPIVTIGCAARMLAIKGIADLVEASRILRTRKIPHRLVLAGSTDPENPDSIAESRLREWERADGIEWLGPLADVRDLWRVSDIAVLASVGGEGLPLSLVEAAACARPLVATDVAGSREIAQARRNAELAPPNAPALLADALQRLIEQPDLRQQYAAASRELAESGFSSEHIAAATLVLYDRLIAEQLESAAS